MSKQKERLRWGRWQTKGNGCFVVAEKKLNRALYFRFYVTELSVFILIRLRRQYLFVTCMHGEINVHTSNTEIVPNEKQYFKESN